MYQAQTQFTFEGGTSMADVEGTLQLARLAVETLHGTDRLAIEVRTRVDHETRTVTVEGDGEVARSLVLLFFGLARREFGAGAVRVRSSGQSGLSTAMGVT